MEQIYDQYEKVLVGTDVVPSEEGLMSECFKLFPGGDLMQRLEMLGLQQMELNFKLICIDIQGVLGDSTIVSFKLLYRLCSYFILNINAMAKQNCYLIVFKQAPNFDYFKYERDFLNSPEISNAVNVWTKTSQCKYSITPPQKRKLPQIWAFCNCKSTWIF